MFVYGARSYRILYAGQGPRILHVGRARCMVSAAIFYTPRRFYPRALPPI